MNTKFIKTIEGMVAERDGDGEKNTIPHPQPHNDTYTHQRFAIWLKFISINWFHKRHALLRTFLLLSSCHPPKRPPKATECVHAARVRFCLYLQITPTMYHVTHTAENLQLGLILSLGAWNWYVAHRRWELSIRPKAIGPGEAREQKPVQSV